MAVGPGDGGGADRGAGGLRRPGGGRPGAGDVARRGAVGGRAGASWSRCCGAPRWSPPTPTRPGSWPAARWRPPAGAEAAARFLVARHAWRAVLVKGGHLDEARPSVTDVLVTPDGVAALVAPARRRADPARHRLRAGHRDRRRARARRARWRTPSRPRRPGSRRASPPPSTRAANVTSAVESRASPSDASAVRARASRRSIGVRFVGSRPIGFCRVVVANERLPRDDAAGPDRRRPGRSCARRPR